MIKPENIIKNPSVLLDEAKSLVDALIEITKNYEVPGEYLDLKNEKNYGRVMVDDFGDYIPFVAWLGKLTDQKYLDWANKKGKYIINNFQMPNGLYFTEHSTLNSLPKKNDLKLFDADKMSDTILGVNLMFELTDDEFYLESSKKFFKGLKKHFLSKEGYVYFKVFPNVLKFPFCMGKLSGLYIEEAMNLYRFTNDKTYLKLAEKMVCPWMNNIFVKNEGLFPFICINNRVRPFAEILFRKKTSFSFDTVMMTKSNTNLIDGIISLNSKLSSDEIKRVLESWVLNVRKKLYSDGVLFAIWSKQNVFDIHYMGSDHAVIASLLEIHRIIKSEEARLLALEIIKSLLKRQSKSGLFPEIVKSYNTMNINKRMLNLSMIHPNISRLDTQTDFGVVLLKSYELTADKKYLDIALKILCGVINNHKCGRYFTEFVDTETMEKKSDIIETKMLFLLNKFFIMTYYVLSGNKIYEDDFVLKISRDR